MNQTEIRIESGRNSDGLRIYVKDEVSGVMLAGFTLDAQEAWDLIGGGVIHVEGIVTDHLERVGKTMQHAQEVYHARHDLPGSTYDQLVADAEQAARADRPGWDEYSGRRNNTGGVTVTLRKWR